MVKSLKDLGAVLLLVGFGIGFLWAISTPIGEDGLALWQLAVVFVVAAWEILGGILEWAWPVLKWVLVGWFVFVILNGINSWLQYQHQQRDKILENLWEIRKELAALRGRVPKLPWEQADGDGDDAFVKKGAGEFDDEFDDDEFDVDEED